MRQYYVKIYDEDGESSICGEFDTKEEALNYREDLIKKGFDYVGAFERKNNEKEKINGN